MTTNPSDVAGLLPLVDHDVVIDLASPFVIVGRLTSLTPDSLVVEEVDVHDLRDTTTTRERYVIECAQHGVRPNRRKAWISRRDVVAISRLTDVVVE